MKGILEYLLVRRIILLSFFYPFLTFSNAQINKEYNDSNDFIPVEIKCISYKSDRIIIKSEEEYKSLYNSNQIYEFCQNYILPEIDFGNYILIGISTTSAGCSIQIDENMIIDPSTKSCDIRIKKLQR